MAGMIVLLVGRSVFQSETFINILKEILNASNFEKVWFHGAGAVCKGLAQRSVGVRHGSPSGVSSDQQVVRQRQHLSYWCAKSLEAKS